jgi:hypothetical protein
LGRATFLINGFVVDIEFVRRPGLALEVPFFGLPHVPGSHAFARVYREYIAANSTRESGSLSLNVIPKLLLLPLINEFAVSLDFKWAEWLVFAHRLPSILGANLGAIAMLLGFSAC